MKVTITQITRKEAQGKKGPYTRIGMKVQEYGDVWLSGFGRKDNVSWKAGDTVDVEIKKVEKDGKEYINFEMPERAQALGYTMEDRDRLMRIEIAVQTILNGLKTLALDTDKVIPKRSDEDDWNTISREELPF